MPDMTLLTPGRIDGFDTPNRMVMAPMTRCRADADRAPHALNAEYYAQRAKRQKSPDKREHLARAAEHYRELAKLEEEVGGIPPKPPAPSV